MPVYQFRCPECAYPFEEKRTFGCSDDPAVCPKCGQRATKVFTSAMYYTPGMAAKGLLAPKSGKSARPAAHGADCPCCGGR
jgi:putative FmdB family regulatory protein